MTTAMMMVMMTVMISMMIKMLNEDVDDDEENQLGLAQLKLSPHLLGAAYYSQLMLISAGGLAELEFTGPG